MRADVRAELEPVLGGAEVGLMFMGGGLALLLVSRFAG